MSGAEDAIHGDEAAEAVLSSAKAATKASGMDMSAVLAILVLVIALIVPVVMLVRTQNAANRKEVCGTTALH